MIEKEENDRLDLYHHIQTLRLDGELHLAPIGPEPQRVLDLATGTGIWAIDFGDKYPTAEVLGNDISPIQPSLVPPNVKFEVDDLEDEWVYSTKFDYIHARYLCCSIRDWPKLMRQAFKYVLNIHRLPRSKHRRRRRCTVLLTRGAQICQTRRLG